MDKKYYNNLPDLVGYIKDMAWEYEHEVRVLTAVDKSIECDDCPAKQMQELP